MPIWCGGAKNGRFTQEPGPCQHTTGIALFYSVCVERLPDSEKRETNRRTVGGPVCLKMLNMYRHFIMQVDMQTTLERPVRVNHNKLLGTNDNNTDAGFHYGKN